MNISIKQLVLTLFLACEALSLAVFAGLPVEPFACSERTSMLLKPRVTISFTIARNRDCEGFGLCDISISATYRKNSVTGTMQVDEYNSNIILLEVDKTRGISPEAYTKYFKSGTFIMEDDAPLPADLVKSLGLSGTRILVAGNHRVIERNGILQVAIPVR